MDTIKVGVIGVGYLGKYHAQKYAAIPGVELVGVADTDEGMGRRVAEQTGAKYFKDFKELLAVVQAVSVVVPTSGHFEVASVCLAEGIDVMLEKPMTSTLVEADALIELADRRNLVLQVGHLERYNPAILAMEQYLTKPMFIESHRIHVFKNRGTDVDVVLDLMIHDIDIIMSLVNSPIKTIHTVGMPVVTQTTDIANARLIFENGCTANITVSRISRDNIRRLRIFQPRSFISVDYAKKEIMVIKHSKELGEDGLPKEEIINSCFIEIDALETELKDFIANVRARSIPRVSGLAGRRALATALLIMEQIKEHIAAHRHFFAE
ncbi:MAG: UDP-N-acetyl-D-glucosamine dehydrogenase [Deltaproteobacteria bacterium RIFOXYD12_FULL_50_9]|nr:MAG: UDP-N-acetyl-D-glucosamine dehydrogenase [Deltaproteobacteria bacterium RIFOXYD12_FULL_50_9]